jgi:transglutaminase-like putative cysteine protease
MLILFILFPRIPGPLWTLPENTQSGLTGLSEQMSPGSLNELILSDKVAFRVRFDEVVPASDKLYWRGLVLAHFKDNTWFHREDFTSPRFPYEATASRVDYTVMLEPHGQHWLFALDVPAQIPPQSLFNRSYQLRHEQPVNDRLQYRMSSYLQYRALEPWPANLRSYLWLPRASNPRAVELAGQWRSLPPVERVRSALNMFRQQPFYYTLKPPLLGEHSVDEFLFETRRGFCEHYASSFAFLMRAADIPARVVLGYQGGEQNGDYLIVRQSDAHAWTEVWLDQQGWVRVDPTAAVAPQRVEQGLYAAVDDPEELPFFARRQDSWLRHMALSLDKLNTAWNEWILGYDNIRQQQLLSRFGFGQIDWRGMTITMISALTLLMMTVSAWYLWQRWRAIDPLSRVYRRFCRKLARSGLPRRQHEGPLAFTERVAAARPDLAPQVNRIGRLYAALRYDRTGSSMDLHQLRQWVNQLRAGSLPGSLPESLQ